MAVSPHPPVPLNSGGVPEVSMPQFPRQFPALLSGLCRVTPASSGSSCSRAVMTRVKRGNVPTAAFELQAQACCPLWPAWSRVTAGSSASSEFACLGHFSRESLTHALFSHLTVEICFLILLSECLPPENDADYDPGLASPVAPMVKNLPAVQETWA